jgi:hypothetical protein
MSAKKQTSVDVLFEKLWDTPKDKWEWNAVLKEVIEMHKEEIGNAWVNGSDVGYDLACGNISFVDCDNAQNKYYTNTFE